MARYTMEQLYERYKKNYEMAQESTLLTRKFTKEGFEKVYNAMKTSGVKKNITRAILSKQNLLSKERLKNLDSVAISGKIDLKKLKSELKDVKFIEEKYGSFEFIPYGGTDNPFKETANVNRQFTDSQMFFAKLIDSGFTKEEAEEAYGY